MQEMQNLLESGIDEQAAKELALNQLLQPGIEDARMRTIRSRGRSMGRSQTCRREWNGFSIIEPGRVVLTDPRKRIMTTENSKSDDSAPAKAAEFKPTYKFPQSKAIVEAMIGNLTENMANPEAVEAYELEKQVAAAQPHPSSAHCDSISG